MTYRLRFVPAALKEWEKRGAPVKNQFKKKLAERRENPHVTADKLSGYGAFYKIKPRAAGYRLVYEIVDDELFVYVLAVGKRDKDKVYATLKRRM